MAGRIEEDWLFYVGVALLVIALLIPVRADQTTRERLRTLVDHLPGSRWFGRR